MNAVSPITTGELASAVTVRSSTFKTSEYISYQVHIELNLIRKGSLTYLHGGIEMHARAGQLVVFWSAIPHPILGATKDVEYFAVTIPLTWFLQFRLLDDFTRLILDGHVLVEPRECSRCDFDVFERWVGDLRLRQPTRHRIVQLELEARLSRFAEALTHENSNPVSKLKPSPTCDANNASRIRQMLSFIAQNYTEHITVEHIGRSAGLHPNYAMNLFRKIFGKTLICYVTHLRISRAQQLLATSEEKIVNVALRSGFNSLSRFNDTFKKACGSSPRQYRERCRNSGNN